MYLAIDQASLSGAIQLVTSSMWNRSNRKKLLTRWPSSVVSLLTILRKLCISRSKAGIGCLLIRTMTTIFTRERQSWSTFKKKGIWKQTFLNSYKWISSRSDISLVLRRQRIKNSRIQTKMKTIKRCYLELSSWQSLDLKLVYYGTTILVECS